MKREYRALYLLKSYKTTFLKKSKNFGKKLLRYFNGFLIINMINKEPKIRKDQLIFIDTDASGFYWDSLGMKISRHSDRTHRDVVGEGYEKNITFSDLSKKVLGICYGE